MLDRANHDAASGPCVRLRFTTQRSEARGRRASLGNRTAAILLALLIGFVSPTMAEPCAVGISPVTTQRLFDRVKSAAVGPGYFFDGLGTSKSDDGQMELVVRWSLEGRPCPIIHLRFENCTSE